MATYERSGQAVIWHRKRTIKIEDRNIPNMEEILKAAYEEFPDCCLAGLEIIACGDDVLLEVRPVCKPS